MFTPRRLLGGCLLLPLLGGCGKEEPMPMDTQDMASPAADMTESKDLTPPPDMTMPPDMVTPADKPMLTGLPTCQDVILNAEQFYEKTFKLNCTNMTCHARMSDADAVKRWWVGKSSMVMSVTLPLVKPGQIHESYVMYKIMGQHMNPLVKGAGTQMPRGQPMLSSDHICNFINWIKGGAN